jgi:hypothetical protein
MAGGADSRAFGGGASEKCGVGGASGGMAPPNDGIAPKLPSDGGGALDSPNDGVGSAAGGARNGVASGGGPRSDPGRLSS